MPGQFGAGKELQPSSGFNNDGQITYAYGDFDSLIEKLQAAIGQMYVIRATKSTREIVIKRITDV